jgi:hypothetical protein
VRNTGLAAGGNYAALADLIVGVMQHTGTVARAFVALDHDEYGAEHIVLDAPDGVVRRVHHVFVYPRDEDTGEPYMEGEPTLTGVAPADATAERSGDPGALVDGPQARAAVARLYGVPAEVMEAAAIRAIDAHEGLCTVGEPFAMWLDALGLRWIGESGGRTLS